MLAPMFSWTALPLLAQCVTHRGASLGGSFSCRGVSEPGGRVACASRAGAEAVDEAAVFRGAGEASRGAGRRVYGAIVSAAPSITPGPLLDVAAELEDVMAGALP